MAAAHPSRYLLFNPRKRSENKKAALKIAAHYLAGEPADEQTVATSAHGQVHVAAYTDADGAMIRTAADPEAFGDVDWHQLGQIAMVREIPSKAGGEARCVIYLCEIAKLFDRITIGKAGVSWKDVALSTVEKPQIMMSATVADEVGL
ncbi:MAG: hypothetical protein ACR2PZ_14855 [Pseudomonadales bacterium]